MRHNLVSWETGGRIDFGQDEVPSSTHTGKKEVKELQYR